MSIVLSIFEKSAEIILPILWKETLLSLWLFPFILLLSCILKNKNQLWNLGIWNLLILRLLLPPDFSHPLSAGKIINQIVPNAHPSFFGMEEMALHSSPQNLMVSAAQIQDLTTKTLNPLSLLNILFMIWLAGMWITASLFISRRKHFLLIIKQATPLTTENMNRLLTRWKKRYKIKRPIQLVTSNTFSIPFTVGTLHPVIYIPKPYLKLEEKILESILAHEMAHIKRFDDFWILLQNLIQSIYFFNPTLWLAIGKIHLTRECICDDMVLSFRKLSAENYGKGLLAVLHYNHLGSRGFGIISALENPHQKLRFRIQNMKGDHCMKKNQSFRIVSILFVFGLFILPITGKTGQSLIPIEKHPSSNPEQNHQDSTETLSIQNNNSKPIRTFIKPVKVGKVISGYGMRIHPITRKEAFHQGIDIPNPTGTPVVASADGNVIFAKSRLDEAKNIGYGRYITLQHKNGFISRYAQLDSVCVQVNQKVKQGVTIGFIGNSGYGTGSHLHFEIRKENTSLDPEKLINF